jgi:hypothetical protein
MVASSRAMDPLHWALRTVIYHFIAMAIKTTSKVGVCVHRSAFACCPGGHRGTPEQVVAWWQLPGAFSLFLDMLHWAMLHALLSCVRMAIEMACDGGTFARHRRLFHLL